MTKHNHITRDNKLQEFWIRFLTGDNYSTHQITDVSMNKLTSVPSEHDYHVIEYSAYEKLQQENERLTKALEVVEVGLDRIIDKAYDIPIEHRMFDSIKHKESLHSIMAREILAQINRIKKG